MTFSLRTVVPFIGRTAAEEFDSLIGCASASIIIGERGTEVGLAYLKEVKAGPVNRMPPTRYAFLSEGEATALSARPTSVIQPSVAATRSFLPKLTRY